MCMAVATLPLYVFLFSGSRQDSETGADKYGGHVSVIAERPFLAVLQCFGPLFYIHNKYHGAAFMVRVSGARLVSLDLYRTFVCARPFGSLIKTNNCQTSLPMALLTVSSPRQSAHYRLGRQRSFQPGCLSFIAAVLLFRSRIHSLSYLPFTRCSATVLSIGWMWM